MDDDIDEFFKSSRPGSESSESSRYLFDIKTIQYQTNDQKIKHVRILQPEEIQRKQQQHLTTHKRKKKKKRLRRRKKLNVAQDLFIDDGLSSDEGIPFESLITSRTKRNSKRVVSHESLTVDECPDISLNHTLMDFQKTPVEIKHVKNYLSYDDDGSLFMNSKHGREINSTTVRETTLEEGTNDIPFHANHSLSLMVSDHGHWNKQTIAFNENGGTFMNRDYYKVASLFNCQMGIFGSGIIQLFPFKPAPMMTLTKWNYIFHVINGKIRVSINGNSFIVRKRFQFYIPEGNNYSLHNLSTQVASLFVVQIKSPEVIT